MSEKINREKKEHKNRDIKSSIDKMLENSMLFLQNNFDDLKIINYKYSAKEAVDELGLDFNLINQLVEDYVTQILKSKALFIEHIEILKKDRDKSKLLNYTPLRELAHKNLGVARNLRIEDGEKFLDDLMKKTDLDYLGLCVDALEACVIRLKPKCAYNTLRLIEIKSSL